MVKNSDTLVSDLLEIPTLKEAKERFPVHDFLQKVLTKQIFDMVLFAKYNNRTLTIGVHHPTAQFEINSFKPILIKYAKGQKYFEDIADVRIFRYEKLKPQPLSLKEISPKIEFYVEKSYGIFENNLKDKELFDKIESIRNTIKKGNTWK
ncbi:hypothetical protein [Arcobacter sp. FWKO B]|uniref:hypothetical protein n=1 Tax=Arcobacter sp. FWKO B TaxID=2593672 RepID=UPI0018A4F52E|nr:hypothetical protein [Arcobacter sp. FWKO B]QOG12223.1 hypothetical protein FWKOB_05680 [Arcobacter sp. FWKO B]